MFNNVPGHEDIGSADTARPMFWLGQRAVHVPVSAFDKILPVNAGFIDLSKHGLHLDGREETSAFEDAFAVALDRGWDRIMMPGGRSVELIGATLPEGSFHCDFNGSTLLGNFNDSVAGATDKVLVCDMMRGTGTNIGDMTENGGLSAAIPGAFVQTASDGVTILGTGLTAAQSAGVAAASGYIGKSFTTARRIFRATVYASTDAGYATGANPNITMRLYASNTAPETGTDGTELAELIFADTSNESATPRELVSDDQTTGYLYVWVYVERASGTGVRVSALQFDGASTYDLTLANFVIDGQYDNGGSLLAERTGLDVWGYRNYNQLESKITGFARGGKTPRIIFNRDIHHTRIHDCLNVFIDGYIQDANAAGEEIVVSCSDPITQYLIRRVKTINKISSGSSLSVYNCGPGQVLNNYVQSVSGSAFNLLTRNVECAYNDVLSTGSHGIDLSEGLIYSHGSWVHHNIIRGADDACITGCGNGLRIENNLFTGDGAWGVNSQNSLNGTTNFGSWPDMTEHDITGMKIKGNRSLNGFAEEPTGFITNANVRFVGNSGAEYHALEIDVTDEDYPTTKVDQNIWMRRVASAKIRGKLMHGSEALVRVDQQCGIIELDHVTMEPETGQGVIGVAVVDANLDCLIVNASDAAATFDVGSQHIAISGTGTIDRIVINNSPTVGVASGGAGGLSVGSALVERNGYSYQTIATDAAFTLTPGTSPRETRHTGTLTADRAVTLSTTGAYTGLTFKITRTGAGAFNLNVGTGPLKALVTNTWCEVTFDGTAWYLSAYGAL